MKRQRNRSCVYTGLVGAKLTVPAKRVSTRARNMHVVQLCGGPLAGAHAKLDMDAQGLTLPLAPMGAFGPGRYRLSYTGARPRAQWEEA